MSLLVAVQDIEQTQELLIRHVEAYKTESFRCQMVSTIGRLGAEMRSNTTIAKQHLHTNSLAHYIRNHRGKWRSEINKHCLANQLFTYSDTTK